MVPQVIVASDGQAAALGALRTAEALAEQHGASVEVVSVVPPFPFPTGTATDLAVVQTSLQELDRAAMKAAFSRVNEQLAALGPAAGSWPITVEVGPPPQTLIRLAEARRASLIVLGLGRHAVADRLFGTETALQVMRLAHVPVLAVPAEARELPRTAVVAVDFSEFSRDAAHSAVGLLAPRAEVHLAHVLSRPAPETPWMSAEWVESYHSGVALKLEVLARVLEEAADVRVHVHSLEGDPAHELVELARKVQADLIAAGSHGLGFFGRVLMGSVSARLVRRATCAVLIAPPREVPAELQRFWSRGAEDAERTARVDAGSWG